MKSRPTPLDHARNRDRAHRPLLRPRRLRVRRRRAHPEPVRRAAALRERRRSRNRGRHGNREPGDRELPGQVHERGQPLRRASSTAPGKAVQATARRDGRLRGSLRRDLRGERGRRAQSATTRTRPSSRLRAASFSVDDAPGGPRRQGRPAVHDRGGRELREARRDERAESRPASRSSTAAIATKQPRDLALDRARGRAASPRFSYALRQRVGGARLRELAARRLARSRAASPDRAARG